MLKTLRLHGRVFAWLSVWMGVCGYRAMEEQATYVLRIAVAVIFSNRPRNMRAIIGYKWARFNMVYKTRSNKWTTKFGELGVQYTYEVAMWADVRYVVQVDRCGINQQVKAPFC